MENKYQLTQEEINKIVRRSPYVLGVSPAEQGIGAEQIKRYFYDFIYYMAEKLNLSLSAIERDIATLSNTDNALQGELEEKIANHSADESVHADIRELAKRAYNLAVGKSKVYVNTSFKLAITELQNEALNQGDFIMVTEKNTPDFVVLDAVGEGFSSIQIQMDDLMADNLPVPLVGEMYCLSGFNKILLAIESGIDTSAFATREHLESVLDCIGQNRTIASVTLEEDATSIEITSEAFADIGKVTDLIITFEIAKPTESNSKPLYVRFEDANHPTSIPVAAVVGNATGGWAHKDWVLKGTLASFCIGTKRICIAPKNLGANGLNAIDLCNTVSMLPYELKSIVIVPALATELIPKGSVIKIEGRVVG